LVESLACVSLALVAGSLTSSVQANIDAARISADALTRERVNTQKFATMHRH
jgi:hypothetical protein